MLSGSHLNNRVDIQRSTVSYGDVGQSTETFTTQTTGAACLIQYKRGMMVDTESNQEYYPTHLVFFRNGEDVLVGDILNDGTDDYYVRSVNQAGGMNAHIECEIELMEGHR